MEVQRRLKAAAFSMATITWQMNYKGYQGSFESPMWWFRPEIDGALMTEEPNYGLPTHFEFTSFTIQTESLDGGTTGTKRLNVYLSTANGGKGELIYSSPTVSARHGTYQIDVSAAGIGSLNSAIAAETFYGISIEFNKSSSSTQAGPRILQAVNEGLLPQTVTLQADLVFAASPATATATAPNATARAWKDASHTAGAMPMVYATMHDAKPVGTSEILRMLSPEVFASESSSNAEVDHELRKLNTGIGSYQRAEFFIKVPLEEAKNGPLAVVTNAQLVLKPLANNTGMYWRLTGYNRVGDTWVAGDLLYEWSSSPTVRTISIPTTYEYVLLSAPHNSNGDGRAYFFDNPARDDGGDYNGSYFIMYVQPDPGTYVHPEPMEVSGQMVSPGVDTVDGAIHGAVAATATAEMPGGRFPHNNFNATPATATATMGASWFRSARTVAADVMDVSVEALEIAGVSVGRNISVAVQPAVMHNAWIVNPMEVNEEVSDPYWNRVLGRSESGSKPPRAAIWFRLNERDGTSVRTTNGTTGLKTTAGYQIEGDYEWGQPGPNGKRALKVRNAEMGQRGDGEWSNLTGGSVELTLKVEPGHTGRMDIANGRDVSFYSSSNPADLNISVRDGKLYAATNLGGASLQRIDDGKWHHIVVTSATNTPGWSTGGIEDGNILQIWIDGKLDRNITKATGETPYGWYSWSGAQRMAAPRRYFGYDTGFPFQGEILDFVYRRSPLLSHEIQDLYLDMFGHMAARASMITAGQGDMFQGHRVESNMKRMLMLTWQIPQTYSSTWPGITKNDPIFDRSVAIDVPRTVDPNNARHLSPMGMYKNLGAGRYEGTEEWDLGRLLISYQRVSSVGIATTEEAKAANPGGVFRDPKTGRRRLVNLQTDLNLDEFDVIAFQAYPNPQYSDQHEREAYEAFFESVKQAMVDGHKFWITDAYLAADLGLVSDVEYVPTMGRRLSNGGMSRLFGNDVRGYEVFPTISVQAGKPLEQGVSAGFVKPVAKEGPTKVNKPVDGSMPELPKGLPMGSQNGLTNLWEYDFHQNNGFRVVNEVEGLTDIPSWELDEIAGRQKSHMFPKDLQWEQWAYRLKNRSGEDFVWKYEAADGEEKILVKPSEHQGVKAGDEFYDWDWFQWVREIMAVDRQYGDSISRRMTIQRRAMGTWAIPPGHLKAGTPVTTFRSTTWNDYGDEVTNPYKDFVRTAVIRPGDRLPDGRKVQGAVFMEFAQHPVWNTLWGIGMRKQLTRGPGEPVPVSEYGYVESEYSFDWDYNTHGRHSYSGGGDANVSNRMLRFTWDRDKNGELIPQWEVADDPLPIAQDISELYPIAYVPNWTWNGRGLAWLLGLGVTDAEYSVTLGETMRASGEMRSPMVSTEFDNEVTVGAAEANARAVDPEEATVKDTQVMAWAATASGRMMGLQGGYRAQAATAHAMMLQNVLRPLDVEEVLFFTVSFTQKTIYLRMEEN